MILRIIVLMLASMLALSSATFSADNTVAHSYELLEHCYSLLFDDNAEDFKDKHQRDSASIKTDLAQAFKQKNNLTLSNQGLLDLKACFLFIYQQWMFY